MSLVQIQLGRPYSKVIEILTNGARWYGETPEGRAEYAKQLKSDVGSISKSVPSGFPRIGTSSPFSKPEQSAFSSSASDHLQRQNQWLVTTLCCM